MPDALASIYGGLGFGEWVVYSNFVASLDGVVTLGSKPNAGSEISGRHPHDRFLMGLLRAFAHAVLLGAGTLRATPRHLWTAEHIFPDLAESFAALRTSLALEPHPRLIVITSSGDIPVSHPAVVAGATIITTGLGAQALRHRLPDSCDVAEVIDDPIDMDSVVEELRNRGYKQILTEGGPHVMGGLIRQNLLDEAFLTVSPVVAGRDGDPRLGMVAGAEFLPARGVWSRLLSARRHGDFLFLRYGMRKP